MRFYDLLSLVYQIDSTFLLNRTYDFTIPVGMILLFVIIEFLSNLGPWF
jgi:hypothetical protein